MNYITERNERRGRRHALVLAVSLHLALAALMYFKMSAEAPENPTQPVKVNFSKDPRTAALP